MPHSTGNVSAPRILFLDAYDSFSNNISALLTEHIGAEVVTIKIDDPTYLNNHAHFLQLLKEFDAVLAGPGPGSPSIPKDVGLIANLWSLAAEDVLPVLGICLGFQSLACAFGGKVQKLKEPRHGIVQQVKHNDEDIFVGVGDVVTTQYHSLHVQLPSLPKFCRQSGDLSSITNIATAELRPLAWVEDDDNGEVLMAVKHTSKPFWAVQFHPESVCSETRSCSKIVKNWWQAAQAWSDCRGRLLNMPVKSRISELPLQSSLKSPAANEVKWEKLFLDGLNTVTIFEALQGHSTEAILLESGMLGTGRPVNPETGRFSIVGVLDEQSLHLEYRTATCQLTTFTHDLEQKSVENVSHIYQHLDDFMSAWRARHGPGESPFWGGIVGFISYEACLDTIDIPTGSDTGRPDLAFVFVDRSVVIDHIQKCVYVQTVRREDGQWLQQVFERLQTLRDELSTAEGRDCKGAAPSSILSEPDQSTYRQKVLKCQELIRAGESYELCLTDTTHVRCAPIDPWQLYKHLRHLNSAPFAAYLHLRASSTRCPSSSTLSILSSSPERFLSWTRPYCPSASSKSSTQTVQYRPIKGTLRKTPSLVLDPERAHALLATPKEQAENLMIVDLIRHDLHGVVGAGNVEVTKLMSVEEYETVWQLVSVIEGTITSPAHPEHSSEPQDVKHHDTSTSATKTVSPIDVLAASLPPGSMTGAPKQRSCEILQALEGRPRDIYSGVLGYMDVGGGGDFSVVIRTAWRWSDDVVAGEAAESSSSTDGSESTGVSSAHDQRMHDEIWHIGAGGAVTAQSTDEGEGEEMLTKRAAVLKLFASDDDSIK